MNCQQSLSLLNKKCDNLKSSSEAWLSFLKDQHLLKQKYELLIVLQQDINNLITKFDSEQEKENALDESNEVIKLIVEIYEHLNNFIKLNQDTLNKPTNSSKSIAENTVYYGSKALALGGLYATGGLSLFPAALGWYGSGKASSTINDAFGFSAEFTNTMNLLNDLKTELEKIYNVFSKNLLDHSKQPLVKMNIESAKNELLEATTKLITMFTGINPNITFTTSNNMDVLNSYSEVTDSYIKQVKRENLLAQIEELQLTEEEANQFEKFKDFITTEYMNIPVTLNGNVLCDLETLLKISCDNKGNRNDPVNHRPFYLCQITGALSTVNEMKEAIAQVKLQRENQKKKVQSTEQATTPSSTVITLQRSSSPFHQPSSVNNASQQADNTERPEQRKNFIG